MPDIIALANKDLLIYWGGLFDGEGYVSVLKGKGWKRRDFSRAASYSISLGVKMVDTEPLEGICDVLGGTIYHCPPAYEGCASLSDWRVMGKATGKAAEQLLPFVKIERKQKALQCIIEFAKTIGKAGVRLCGEVIEQRDKLVKQCRELNTKGPRDTESITSINIESVTIETLQLSLFGNGGIIDA